MRTGTLGQQERGRRAPGPPAAPSLIVFCPSQHHGGERWLLQHHPAPHRHPPEHSAGRRGGCGAGQHRHQVRPSALPGVPPGAGTGPALGWRHPAPVTPQKGIKFLPTGTRVRVGVGGGSQVVARGAGRWAQTLPATGRARRGQGGGTGGTQLRGSTPSSCSRRGWVGFFGRRVDAVSLEKLLRGVGQLGTERGTRFPGCQHVTLPGWQETCHPPGSTWRGSGGHAGARGPMPGWQGPSPGTSRCGESRAELGDVGEPSPWRASPAPPTGGIPGIQRFKNSRNPRSRSQRSPGCLQLPRFTPEQQQQQRGFGSR